MRDLSGGIGYANNPYLISRIKQNSKKKKDIVLNGRKITYYVVSHKVRPKEKYFAGNAGVGVFYLSESIPPKYHCPILVHEIVEAETLSRLGQTLRRNYDYHQLWIQAHRKALKAEISDADKRGILSEYLLFRSDKIQEKLKNNPDSHLREDLELIEQFTKSLKNSQKI